MHLYIFNHHSTPCSNGLHQLILRLPARPYLGLVDEAASFPVWFLPRLAWFASDHYFLFYKVYLNTMDFLFALASQPCLILTFTWEICSILDCTFHCSISLTFLERVPKWSGNFYDHSYVSWLVCPVQFIWGIPDIVARYLNVWLLVYMRFFLVALSCSSVLFNDKAYENIGGGDPSSRHSDSSPCLLRLNI